MARHGYDALVDDQRPANAPGERRLDRPPSERYAQPASDTATDRARAWPIRGDAAAVGVAIAGAVVTTVAGGILTMTAGLLVVAAAIGWAVGTAVSLDGAPDTTARRRQLAVSLAVASVVLGQVGLWLLARLEGGTLGIVDYLGEVFGVLVPAQALVAAAVAWWRTR